MAPLLALQAWFRANPDTGTAVFALAIFLLVYVVRKLWPSLWLRFEALSPALSAEMTALDVVWHKVFQALPSVIAGLLAGPLFFGGDARGAVLGALKGLLAPIGHELLKNYRGRLGIGKTKDPGGPTGSKPVGLTDGARDMTDVATPPEAPTAAMVGVAASPPRVGVMNVEIVINSNQDPSRIARRVMEEMSRRMAPIAGLLLLVAGCSSGVPTVGKHPDPSCSDDAYGKLLAVCAAKAAACVTKGGTESECGSLCDDAADDWSVRCQ